MAKEQSLKSELLKVGEESGNTTSSSMNALDFNYFKSDRRISFNVDAFQSYGDKSNLAFLFYVCICLNYNKDLLGYSRIDDNIISSILSGNAEAKLKYGWLREKLPILQLEQFKELTLPIYHILVELGLDENQINSLLAEGRDAVVNKYISIKGNTNNQGFTSFKELVNNLYDEFEDHTAKGTAFDTVWQDIVYLLQKPIRLTRKGVGLQGENFVRYNSYVILETVQKSYLKTKGRPKETVVYKMSDNMIEALKNNFLFSESKILLEMFRNKDKSLAPLFFFISELRETCLFKDTKGTPAFSTLVSIAGINRDLSIDGAHRKNKSDLNKKLLKILEFKPGFFELSWDKHQPIFEFKVIFKEEISKRLELIRNQILDKIQDQFMTIPFIKQNAIELNFTPEHHNLFYGHLSHQFKRGKNLDEMEIGNIRVCKLLNKLLAWKEEDHDMLIEFAAVMYNFSANQHDKLSA